MIERDKFSEDGAPTDRRISCDRCGKAGPVFLESEIANDAEEDAPGAFA